MADPKDKNKQKNTTEKPKNKLVSGMAKFAKENLNVEGKSKEEVEAIMLQDPKTYERIQKEFYNKIGKKDFATYEEFRDDVHSKYGNPFETQKKKESSTDGSQAGSEAVVTGVSEGQNTSKVEKPTSRETWQKQTDLTLGGVGGQGQGQGQVQKQEQDPLTQNIQESKRISENKEKYNELFVNGTPKNYDPATSATTQQEQSIMAGKTGVQAQQNTQSDKTTIQPTNNQIENEKAILKKSQQYKEDLQRNPQLQADHFLGAREVYTEPDYNKNGEIKSENAYSNLNAKDNQAKFSIEKGQAVNDLNYDPTAPESEEDQIYTKLIAQDNEFLRASDRAGNVQYKNEKIDAGQYTAKEHFQNYERAYNTRMNALATKRSAMESNAEFGKKYEQVKEVMQAKVDAAAMEKQLQEILTKNKLSAENLKDQVLLQQNPWLVEFLQKKAQAEQLAATQINDPQILEYEEISKQMAQLEKLGFKDSFIKDKFGDEVLKERLENIAAQNKVDKQYADAMAEDASTFDYSTEVGKNMLKQVGYSFVDFATGILSLPRMPGDANSYGGKWSGDQFADYINADTEALKAYFPEPTQIKQSVFRTKVDEKGKAILDEKGEKQTITDWEILPYKIVRGLADLGFQILGTKGMGAIKGFNTLRGSSIVGMGATSFVQTYNQSYLQALEKGVDRGNAETFAVSNALITASLEGIAPNSWATKGGADNLFSLMAKNGFKPSAVKEAVKTFTTETGGEMIQEWSQGLATHALSTTMEINRYKQRLDTDQTFKQEMMETGLITFFVGGSMGGVASKKRYSQMSQLTKASAFYLANNTEYGVTQQKLKEQFKLQNIPASKQNEILQTLDDIKERFDVLPPDIKRSKYAANIVDLQAQIEEKKKQVTSPNLPDAIKNKLNEEINELDDRISDLVDKTELNFTSKDKYTKLEASKASIQEELAKEGITEERKTELTERLNSVNNSLATLGDEQAMQDYEAANPKTAEYKAAEAKVEEAKNKALDLRNQIDNASEDITPKAVAILKEQYQQAVQAFRTSEKELEVIASKREATPTNTQTPAEPSQESPAETEATKAVPAFENAKEGDSVIINGKKVVVVGRSKSRKGNDVLVVEEVGATNSKEQIYQNALSDISRRTGETFKNIEKFRAGELSNLVDEYTKIENSRTNTITIDKEQWVSDAKPDETPKVESEATQTQATPEYQAAETKVKEATAKVNDLQNQLDNVSDDVSDADYKALEKQYQQANQELKDSEAELELVASEVESPVQSENPTPVETQSSVNEDVESVEMSEEERVSKIQVIEDKIWDLEYELDDRLKSAFRSKNGKAKIEAEITQLKEELQVLLNKKGVQESAKPEPTKTPTQPTQEPDKQPKVEPTKTEKIADIEERREKELNSSDLYHTGDDLTLDNISVEPRVTRQGRRGQYGGLYTYDNLESINSFSKGNKTKNVFGITLNEGVEIKEYTGSIERLDKNKLDELRGQGYQVIKGKSLFGDTEIIIIDKSAIKGVKNHTEINARYDAELASLKEPTKTEPTKPEPLTKFQQDVASQTQKAREELTDKARKQQKKKLENLLKKKGLKAEFRAKIENELQAINEKLNPKSEEVGNSPREIKINIAAATRRALTEAKESEAWKDMQDDYRSMRTALNTLIESNASQRLIDKQQVLLDTQQTEMHEKGQELVRSIFERETGLKVKSIENSVGRFDDDIEPSHVITFEVKSDAEFARVEAAAKTFSERTLQDAYIVTQELNDADKTLIQKQLGKPFDDVMVHEDIDFGARGIGRIVESQTHSFDKPLSQQEISQLEKVLLSLKLGEFTIADNGKSIQFQFFSFKTDPAEVDAEIAAQIKSIGKFSKKLKNDYKRIARVTEGSSISFYRAANQILDGTSKTGATPEIRDNRTYARNENASEVRQEGEVNNDTDNKNPAPKEDTSDSSGANSVLLNAQKAETEKRLKEQAEEVKAVQSEITRLEKAVKDSIQKGETGIRVEINQKALIAAENLLKEVKARHKAENEPPKPKQEAAKKKVKKEVRNKVPKDSSRNPNLKDTGDIKVGKETELVFSTEEKPVNGYFAYVDLDNIQASNTKEGKSNDKHFISKAQPKKWTDDRENKANMMRDNLRPNDVMGEASTPYNGTPVLNENGEVIQGNGRTIGLGRNYDKKENSEYRDKIIKEGATYGLNPKDAEGMQKPVLVRIVPVSDAEAIRLGQKKSTDLESGGDTRVGVSTAVTTINSHKPTSSRGIPALEQIASIFGREEFAGRSVAQLLQNKDFVDSIVKVMFDVKALNTTERANMFKDGLLNANGKADLTAILDGLSLTRGIPESISTTEIVDTFGTMPASIQEAINESTKFLLESEKGVGGTLYNAFKAYNTFRIYQQVFGSFDSWVNQMGIDVDSPIKTFGKDAINIARFFVENSDNKKIVKEGFGYFMAHYNNYLKGDESNIFSPVKAMNQKDAATAASAKLLDKYKPQPVNKPNTKPRESKGSTTRNQATQRQAAEAMVARLKKAFPKMNDVIFDNTLSGPGEYKNGQVYLNPDKMTMEDAIEEYTHLYLELVKAINPTVFAEGVRVIKNSKEGQEILAEVKRDYPTYSEADQLNEAITKAVARFGVNVKKPNLISRFVDRIRKIIGNKLRAMDAKRSKEKKPFTFFTENFTTTKRFNPGKMTLNEYSKLIAGELLNETPLTYITTEQLENFTSDTNASQPITIARGILQGSPTRLDRFLGAITGNVRTDMNQGRFVVDALRKQESAVAAAQKQVVNNSYILGKNVLDAVNKKFADSSLKGKDLKVAKSEYTTQLLSEINEALGGDINVVNQLTADFPEIAKTVRDMREHIDKTTKELIEAGFLPDDDMVGQFNENLTVFFRRSFDIQKMVQSDVKNGNITQAEADAKMQGITATSVTSKTTKGKGLSLEFTMQDGTKNKFEGLNSQDVYYLFGKVKGMEILKNDGTFEVEPQVLYQNPLYAVLMGNVGKYVNRSYAIHRAEKVSDYLHTVSDSVKTAARELFAERLRNPEIASVSVQKMDNGNFTLVFQNKYGTRTDSHDPRYSNLTADEVTDFFNDDSMLSIEKRRELEILEAKKQAIKEREATTIDEILEREEELEEINDQINTLTYEQKEAKKEKSKKVKALRDARKALRTSAEKIAYEKKRIAKEVSEAYVELDAMKANFNALNARSRRLAGKIRSLTDDKANLTGSDAEIKAAKKPINAEIKALRAERVGLKDQRDVLKARITPLDNAKKQEIERLVSQMESSMEVFPKTDLEEKQRIAAIKELNIKYKDLTANERAAVQMEEEVNNPQRTTNFTVQMPKGLKSPNVQFATNSIYVNAAMEQFLREQINKAGSDGKTPSAKPAKKNMGIMETRKDIPKVLRDLMGQNADPMTVYENTVLKQANLLHAQQMINAMWQEGGEAMFSDKPTATLSSPMISKVGNSAYAPLDGKYTTPEMYAILFEGQEKEQNKAIRTWLMLNGMAKAGLTVYSLASNTRNFVGAGLMTLGTGNFNPLNIKKAFEITMENTRPGKHRQFYEDGVRLGVFGQNLDANILNAQLSRAMGETKLTGIPLIKKFASKYYQFPDDMAKAVTMLGEIDTHRRAAEAAGETRTEEELMEMAAINTKATLPNYALTSRALQKLSRNAVFGTFVMFTAETIRTKWNTMSIAYSEITSGNPVYRKKGLLRATAALGSLTIPPALAFLSMTAAAGIDMGEEEEKGFRATFPDYNKNNLFIYIGRNDDGSPIYLDFTFIDPSSYFHKPLIALAMGKDPEESFNGMLREVFMPFAGTEIFTKDTWNAINNTDDFGRKITDSPSIMWQGVKRGSYAGRNLMPKIVKEGSYMMQGLFNEFIEKDEDKYANYTRNIDLKEELMNNFMGTKLRSFDREKRFKNVLYDLKDAVDNGGKFLKEPTEFLQDANKTVKNISKLATGKSDDTVEVVVKDYKLDEVKAEYRKAAVKIYDAIQGLKAMEKYRTEKGKNLPTIEEIASKMAKDMKLPSAAIGKILDKDFEWTPFKDEKSEL